jgi:hypothetical protein
MTCSMAANTANHHSDDGVLTFTDPFTATVDLARSGH